MKLAFNKLTSSKSFLIIVVLAGVLATLIALAIGVQQSVWFDEAYSVRVAQQPLGDLLSLTAVDTHPPLYYMILKLWAKCKYLKEILSHKEAAWNISVRKAVSMVHWYGL